MTFIELKGNATARSQTGVTRQYAKTRAYASASEQEVFDQFGLIHPPYGRKGEDEANDRGWVAYNRAEKAIMRTKIQRVLDENRISARFRFSRKAGCSCGCSAGFILDRPLIIDGWTIEAITVRV